jgi:hypothetical protein
MGDSLRYTGMGGGVKNPPPHCDLGVKGQNILFTLNLTLEYHIWNAQAWKFLETISCEQGNPMIFSI